MPSGLAKCHSDSYLQTFRTTLLSCKVAPKDDRRNINDKGETKEDNNKKGKKDGKEKDKGKVAEEVKVDSGAPALYDVQLKDTILFPEGGGQPSDMGTLKFNDIVAPVTYVYRDDQDEIFHRVLLSAPIPPQSEVELTLDWKRRWDHMQQHSGQHLISALAQKLLGWETKGWWMSKYPSPSYIEFGTKAASDEELERLEERVNSAIINPAPMRVHTFPSVEAAMQDENFRSRNVDDLSNLKGELRVVEIDGIDFNTCCGTHLQSTTHVQLVKFCGKEGNRGNTRVFFLAGARALHVFGRMIKREQEMTATICCGPDQHVDFAKQLQNDSKSLSKSTKNALAEVAALRGEKMAAEALAGGEQKTVLFFQHDEPTFPLSDMGDILQQRCPNHLALLVAGSLKQGHEGQFLLVGLGDRVTALGNEVAKIVGGRGGGRKGKFQGKIEKLAQKPLDAAVKYLNEQLHAAAPAAEPEKKQ